MYYAHPESEEAYRCPNQYFFGSELIAAPFHPARRRIPGLSRQAVWLPEGDWFDFFSGERLPGGGWQTFYGALDDIPVFARAGAIVPLGPKAGWGGVANPEALEVHLFPGADNAFELYEDDGESEAYRQGHCLPHVLSQRWTGDTLKFEIAPPKATWPWSRPGAPSGCTCTASPAPTGCGCL